MVFDDSMLPETNHVNDGPVVLVDQDEYKALIRDSVFARNFAELIAEDFTFLPQSMRTMLRLYDKEIYRKAHPRTYKENHGEDGENE